jgi:glutamate-1-semialdehyde 2,1-aminomutase
MYECCSAARGYTKRDKIIKLQDVITDIQIRFNSSVSGAITFGSPNGPGVTEGTAKTLY